MFPLVLSYFMLSRNPKNLQCSQYQNSLLIFHEQFENFYQHTKKN